MYINIRIIYVQMHIFLQNNKKISIFRYAHYHQTFIRLIVVYTYFKYLFMDCRKKEKLYILISYPSGESSVGVFTYRVNKTGKNKA